METVCLMALIAVDMIFLMMVIMMIILILHLETQHCAQNVCAKVHASLRNYELVLKKLRKEIANKFDRLDENQMKLMEIITIAIF